MFPKGQITQQVLSKRIRDHEGWLADPNKGRRFQASRTDFIGMDFKGNLSRAMVDNCDFSFTTWEDVRLDGAILDVCDFTHAKLSGVRTAPGKKATLSKCNFSRSEIRNCQFYNAQLTELNFSYAALSNVTFNECRCDTLNFQGAVWNFGGFVNGEAATLNFVLTTISNFVISGCTVYKMHAPSFDFSKVTILKGSKLLQCVFENALADNITFGDGQNDPKGLKSIAWSSFVNAKLSNCFFKAVEVYGCDFSLATMNDSSFSDLDLIGAKFRGSKSLRLTMTNCTAYKVPFAESKGGNWFFSNCELSRADFTNANISQSNLEYSDLTGAKFYGANVDTIDFSGSDLDGAVWLAGQRCKVGSMGRCEL